MSTTEQTNQNSTVEVKVVKKDAGKKKNAMIVGGALAAIGAIYFFYNFLFYVSTDNAQIQANTVILTARVSGYVSKVSINEGQKVTAGETLIEIDPKDYKSRISQSENELGSVMARAQDAERNYHRLQKLFEEGAVSAQQRDTALASYQEFSRRQKSLQAQTDISSNSLNDTQIRAPSNGTIAKKAAEVGMLANPGTPLVAFVSDETRWIVANFKETDLGKVKVGQKVSVEVDAIPGREFHGEVEAFYPATGAIFSLIPPDNATGNFTKVVQRVPARIKLLDLKKEDIDLLKAGLSAEVSVKIR